LVLDEFFALRLYERLRGISTGSLVEMLDRLVVVAGALSMGTGAYAFPVLLGSSTPLWSVLGGALAATIVSAVLAFLSGMNIPRRVFINLSIMGGAVLVSYAIGSLAHRLWGLSL